MKKYADRYILENYARLAKSFEEHEAKLNERGDSPLDRLNDTMLTLYYSDEEYASYEQYEAWAEQKFGGRKGRRNRRCLGVQNTGS